MTTTSDMKLTYNLLHDSCVWSHMYNTTAQQTSQHWHTVFSKWLHGAVVERRSLTSELSLSCARPAADG